jgi:hypothetical protein
MQIAETVAALIPGGGDLGDVGAGLFAAGEETAKELPVLVIDAERMPNIAQNIADALEQGAPDVLHRETDRAIIDANRAAACGGLCAAPGNSLDEFPFAFHE